MELFGWVCQSLRVPTAPEDSWSDAELVASAQQGSRAAFAAIYRRYAPDVHRFVRAMCGSRSVADDVVHDVFVAMMCGLARYQPGRSQLVHYLFGIARNEVRQRARRFWRREVLVEEAPETTYDADPLERRARRERCQAVRRALAALPVKYREVLVLCDMQEMDYASVAEVLAVPIGTVRSRVHRGRRLLVAKMERADEGAPGRRWSWSVGW